MSRNAWIAVVLVAVVLVAVGLWVRSQGAEERDATTEPDADDVLLQVPLRAREEIQAVLEAPLPLIGPDVPAPGVELVLVGGAE